MTIPENKLIAFKKIQSTHEKKSLNTLLVKYYNDYLDMLSSEQGKYGVSNL